MRMYDDFSRSRDTGTLVALSAGTAPRPAGDATAYEAQPKGANGAQPNGAQPKGAHRETPVLIGCRPGAERVAAEWITRRNCADIDPNVFFPNDGVGVITAQKVCAECPVKDPCREYALANNITHGVWGGTSERQRRRILRERRRAAKVG